MNIKPTYQADIATKKGIALRMRTLAAHGELIEFIEPEGSPEPERLIESEDSSDRRSRRGSERPETLRSKIPQGVERLVEPRAAAALLSLGKLGTS